MGNVIIALDKQTEQIMRRLAKRKYGGKKGSLSKVVSEALHKYDQDDQRKKEIDEFITNYAGKLDLGGYKMYKHRDEIYDD
jgi:hypothetical protein